MNLEVWEEENMCGDLFADGHRVSNLGVVPVIWVPRFVRRVCRVRDPPKYKGMSERIASTCSAKR